MLGDFCLLLYLARRLTANRDALPGRYQCPEFLLDGLHRILVIALGLKKLGTIRHGNLTGTARAPVAAGEDEPRLFCSPPLGGKHLNGAHHTRNTKTNIGKESQFYYPREFPKKLTGGGVSTCAMAQPTEYGRFSSGGLPPRLARSKPQS